MEMKIKSIITILFLCILFSGVSSAEESSVSRDLPDGSISAGSSITVKLDVNLGDSSSYTIEEHVPEGWTITKAQKGIISKSKETVAWVAIGTGSSGTLTYEVEIPTAANGSYDFSGLYGIGTNDLKEIDADKTVVVVGGTTGETGTTDVKSPTISIFLMMAIFIVALIFRRINS